MRIIQFLAMYCMQLEHVTAMVNKSSSKTFLRILWRAILLEEVTLNASYLFTYHMNFCKKIVQLFIYSWEQRGKLVLVFNMEVLVKQPEKSSAAILLFLFFHMTRMSPPELPARLRMMRYTIRNVVKTNQPIFSYKRERGPKYSLQDRVPFGVLLLQVTVRQETRKTIYISLLQFGEYYSWYITAKIKCRRS